MIPGHVLLCGPAEPAQVFDCADQHELLPGLGGVPVNLLARALASRGWQVTVVSTSPDVAEPWRHREANVEIVLVPERVRARERALDFFKIERRALTDEIRRQRPDLVHAHWTYEFALAALTSGLPTLVTAHDAPLTILRHLRDPYRVARLAMALWVRAKRPPLTAVSPYLAEQWRREMGWRRDIAIIPNIGCAQEEKRVRVLRETKTLGYRGRQQSAKVSPTMRLKAATCLPSTHVGDAQQRESHQLLLHSRIRLCSARQSRPREQILIFSP